MRFDEIIYALKVEARINRALAAKCLAAGNEDVAEPFVYAAECLENLIRAHVSLAGWQPL